MGKCKRNIVVAKGFRNGEVVIAVNGNKNECTGEMGNCGCTHAEINLLKTMHNPQRVHVTISPCIDCAKALVNSGVKIVEYEKEYRKRDGIKYLLTHGVSVRC